MDEKITSRENAKVKYACRLASSAAFRRTEGRFLAEGRKLCPELARGAELETLFYTENALEKCPELAALPGEHYLVEDHVADKLADVGTHQGVFGVFRTPVHTLEEVRPGGRYLALERVQDPGNVGTLLLQAVYTFLWTCLLIVPGFIKAYEYCMIPYLLADHPEMTRQEAFATSKAMMKGNKWKAFVLDLSFIPWDILSALTLGIVSVFYVAPYRQLTAAALYEKLKAQNEVPAAEVPAQGE